MKITKKRLKQIIKEELNEFTISLNPKTGNYELPEHPDSAEQECVKKPLEERPEDW